MPDHDVVISYHVAKVRAISQQASVYSCEQLGHEESSGTRSDAIYAFPRMVPASAYVTLDPLHVAFPSYHSLAFHEVL